jgi:hypothetical protein
MGESFFERCGSVNPSSPEVDLHGLSFLNFLTPMVKWVYITGYRAIGNLSSFFNNSPTLETTSTSTACFVLFCFVETMEIVLLV